MNKLVLLATIAGALLVAASPAIAGGDKNLGCGDGRLVVDVHYQVTGDLDATVPIGSAQYDWALDNYVRHVRVWQTAPGRFCAVTTSRGTFTTLAGHSLSLIHI